MRGRLPDAARADFRLHEDLGFPLWVHRDDETAPERPLVVVLDLPGGGPRRSAATPVNPGSVTALRHTRPAAASAPLWEGPPYRWSAGPHRLDVVVDRGCSVQVTDLLSVVRA